MPTTGFVYHPDYLRHLTGSFHPEVPERLSAIFKSLECNGQLKKLTRIEPVAADEKWVSKYHDGKYVEILRNSSNVDRLVYLDGDTPLCNESFRIALLAVGGVLEGISRIMEKTVENCFCAVRPPGHHAGRDWGMGFCLLSNVALGANYVREKFHLERIAIVDWDVHHGNGTESFFYDDPQVLYISLHQWPCYPGTGRAEDTGVGAGKGFTLNIPMRAGSGDEDYLARFDEQVLPKLREFSPQFLLVSAGFDGHREDPLAGMQLTEVGYFSMTRALVEIAEEFCERRICSVLEGGYNLEALCASVECHLRALAGEVKV
jgi:acetoin utilization deacetylase AcuC-like enzyme